MSSVGMPAGLTRRDDADPEALFHVELACEYSGGRDLDQLVIDASDR